MNSYNVTPRPVARTFGKLLDERARTDPDAAAVFYHRDRVTYGSLSSQSSRFARGLRELGVQRGDRVAVLFANQPEWLVATLSVLRLGATVVPLNTWHKDAELRWTLRHADVSTAIVMDQFLGQDYAGNFATMKRQGLLRHVIATGPRHSENFTWDEIIRLGDAGVPLIDDASETDTAFVLYTSGSSAEPKGVCLAHGDLIANGYEIGRRREITSTDRIWLGAPLFYGLGAANALPVSLTHGAGLVIQDKFTAEGAIAAIQDSQSTVYYGTGNMTMAILASPDFRPNKVASLDRGLAGLKREYRRLVIEELGVSRATPGYGLTETYGHVTGGYPDDPLEVRLETDGSPLPGITIDIVDPESGEPMPVGEVGRILVRGRVAQGYLNLVDPVQSAILPDGRLDTGDLGKLDDKGRLTFVSRLKEVIKSGGVNISAREVEELLVAHPNVSDAYVVGVDDLVDGEIIIGFVTTNGPVTGDILRSFVKERAASFKVPRHIIPLPDDQVPRLASGKVDGRALKVMADEVLHDKNPVSKPA